MAKDSIMNDIEKWDSIAQDYFNWSEGKNGLAGKAFRDLLLENITPFFNDIEGKAILDLGCGDGYFFRHLDNEIFLGKGIDASAEMIRLANEYNLNKNIEFQIGDIATKLPYEDNYFDIIICNMVLMDLEQISNTLQEVSRVLKYSGLFIFSIVHPCFYTAIGDWGKNQKGQPVFEYKRRYIENSKYLKCLTGLNSKELLSHYHRPISFYISELLNNQFAITSFQETSFSKEYLENLNMYSDFSKFYFSATHLIIAAQNDKQNTKHDKIKDTI